jgi:hypothetical protein
MKFCVVYKTPDAIDYAIEDFSEEEKEQCMETASKFASYGGEQIKVEFDTEAGTAIVIPRT